MNQKKELIPSLHKDGDQTQTQVTHSVCWLHKCPWIFLQALKCMRLYCTALPCTEGYWMRLHCTVMYCNILKVIAVHITTLHCCNKAYSTALSCTALHSAVLSLTTFHCTVFMLILPYFPQIIHQIKHDSAAPVEYCTTIQFSTLLYTTHCTTHHRTIWHISSYT